MIWVSSRPPPEAGECACQVLHVLEDHETRCLVDQQRAAALAVAGELRDPRGDAFDDGYELVALRGRVGPSLADLAGIGNITIVRRASHDVRAPDRRFR